MRGKLLGLAVVLFVGAQASFAFDSSELNEVTFANTTGVTIKAIFFSPGDSGEWGPDIMGSERTLPAKGKLSFYVHYPESTGTFDIMAVDEQDRAFIIYDYEFQDGQEEIIQFRARDMADEMPNVDFVKLTLENTLSLDVHYLFLSPSDSKMWGVDILDEETILASEDSVTFIVPVSEEAVDYDVMAVDEDGDTYQFTVTLDPTEDETFTASIESSDYVEN